MSNLAALPLVLNLAGAIACLASTRSVRAQRMTALVTTALLLLVASAIAAEVSRSGPLRLQVGGWPAPFGVALRVDLFSAVMVLVTAVLGLAVSAYSVIGVPREHARFGAYPMMLLLLMGVCGAFLTADLFNLYVWFEVMLIASFVLLGLGARRDQLRGALIYVTLNLVSSAFFLVGVGLLYGAVSTLDFGHLAERVAHLSADRPHLVLAIEAVLLTSFALKAALFPLFFWLPASYHTPPPAVSALFAGLLTKVGLYALIRVTAGVFPSPPAVYDALVAIATITMVTGVLGALAQNHVRRILSFHIVSQLGYMVAGLALAGGSGAGRRFAIAAAIFYTIHHILVKANLFLVAGVVGRFRGTEELARLGGVARARPWLGLLFLIPALSLAGVPPLSGFWAKLAIIEAGLAGRRHLLVLAAVLTGLMTLLSMIKIWDRVFAGRAPTAGARRATRREATLLGIPIAGLAALTLWISLLPETLFSLASAAADQIVELGGRQP